MNLATAIVLLIVAALVVVDVIALRRGKGRCSCETNSNKKGSCAHCSANCPLKGK